MGWVLSFLLLAVTLAITTHASPLSAWVVDLSLATKKFNPPGFANQHTVCSTNRYILPYLALNYTFSTSGVRELIATAELDDFGEANFNIAVYSGSFTPASPCSNFSQFLLALPQPIFGLDGLEVDDFYQFEAGITYFFIFYAEADNFAYYTPQITFNIFESSNTGSSAGGYLWNTLSYFNNGMKSCQVTTNTSPLATYTFLQEANGTFDIIGGFANSPVYMQMSLGLFSGNVSYDVLLKQPCSAVIDGENSETRAAAIYGVYLYAGYYYTVAVSGQTPQASGTFGIQVIPSRLEPLGEGWHPPSTYFAFGCNPSSSLRNTFYYAYAFVATGETTFIEAVGFVVYNIYAYFGNNTVYTPPMTCPFSGTLFDATDQSRLVIFTVPDVTYTVIISSDYNVGYGVDLTNTLVYVLSGTPYPNVNPVTTASTFTLGTTIGNTTGPFSTVSITTGARPTTGGFATTSPFSGYSTTSTAVKPACGLLVVVVLLFLL